MQLTYFSSLLIFLGPPIILLLFTLGRDTWKRRTKIRNDESWSPFLNLSALIMIAVVYTTPWDNYLVATGVWWYDDKLVSGVLIGYVPLEEYIFFIIQTFLTGLGVLVIWNHKKKKNQLENIKNRTRFWVALLLAVIWAISIYLLVFGDRSMNYLTLIISWALIPIFIQIVFGGDILWAHRKSLIMAISIPTIYLWIMDAISIKSGIWTIDPNQTIGLGIGTLPIEEMLFFMLTNVLVSFGMILMLSPHSKVRVKSLYKNLFHSARMGSLEINDV